MVVVPARSRRFLDIPLHVNYWDRDEYSVHAQVRNPGGIRSDEQFFPQGQPCRLVEGGTLFPKSYFRNTLVVLYTQTSLPQPPFRLENGSRVSNKIPGSVRDSECPFGALVEVSVRDYQDLRREWYLREHRDPLVARLRSEADEKIRQEREKAVNQALQGK